MVSATSRAMTDHSPTAVRHATAQHCRAAAALPATPATAGSGVKAAHPPAAQPVAFLLTTPSVKMASATSRVTTDHLPTAAHHATALHCKAAAVLPATPATAGSGVKADHPLEAEQPVGHHPITHLLKTARCTNQVTTLRFPAALHPVMALPCRAAAALPATPATAKSGVKADHPLEAEQPVGHHPITHLLKTARCTNQGIALRCPAAAHPAMDQLCKVVADLHATLATARNGNSRD